jgi:hypothetical protein
MLNLYKDDSYIETEEYLADGAITAGSPVYLEAAAGASGTPKVKVITGGAGTTSVVYGVALSTVSDGGVVQIVPVKSGQVWSAESAATTDATKVAAATNYLDANLKVATGGTITNNGAIPFVVGVLDPTHYLIRIRRSVMQF